MAADQDRADRIRALKKDHPETTWDAIGDYVGVSTRAAQAWQETGGISYENAKKLAELWNEDLGYIMRGRESGERGDVLSALNGNGEDQLARLERKVDEALSLLRALAADRQLEDVERGTDADDEASAQAG